MKNDKRVASVYDFASILMTAVIAVSIIFAFFFKISFVNGGSMNNTLENGDRVIITAKDYNVSYGDIVVVSQPNAYNEVLIKRIIATGGQTIDIDKISGDVLIDGKAIDEPYIREKIRVLGDVKLPLTVPEGFVFVMGDNRNESGDSRFKAVGCIDERYIVGQAIYRLGDTKSLVLEK